MLTTLQRGDSHQREHRGTVEKQSGNSLHPTGNMNSNGLQQCSTATASLVEPTPDLSHQMECVLDGRGSHNSTRRRWRRGRSTRLPSVRCSVQRWQSASAILGRSRRCESCRGWAGPRLHGIRPHGVQICTGSKCLSSYWQCADRRWFATRGRERAAAAACTATQRRGRAEVHAEEDGLIYRSSLEWV